MGMQLKQIGIIHSELNDKATAPKQGSENAPDATLIIDPAYTDATDGLAEGTKVVVITWLDRADRSYQRVHPRGDKSRAIRGVFTTRSPDRPNPIGLHEVTIKRIDGLTLTIGPIETLNGTPVVDIKPVF